MTAETAAPARRPSFTRVLCTTDLSELGDRAIPTAYAASPPGATVVLFHVIPLDEPRTVPNPLYAHYVPGPAPRPEERAREASEIAATLRARVPAWADAAGIATIVDVREARDVAGAIGEAAERHGADVVCTATHGRSGLGKLLFGSVAQEVLRSVRRPIILVPPLAGQAERGARA